MHSNERLPLQVDRVHAPSVEEFNRLYAEPGKPVLITGIVSEWDACSLWNSQYFNSLAGERSVPVKRMRNGAYLKARTELMKLADFLDVVNKEPVGNERVYLSERSVKDILPEIAGDYTAPPYIDSAKFAAVGYIGSHVHSQIHFHPFGKALLCQVTGRKRVKLFAPDQTPYLYQKLHFSKIEGEPVDLEKYPLYENVEYYECEVTAGEMLFFPIYWWHGVETPEFSSAVVFFWDDSRKLRWLPPTGIPLRYVPVFEIMSWIFKGKRMLKRILQSVRG
ncbi:cupin-like domain-containing protein [Candidatus Methylobacter oryzae]|uniref:Cupin-like domain-containing protein n=1 Tax=Candidatus Methylobacter oryzae TaxID=2497749 RepID=A0ABY3CHY8_9GAMM|nr:cupin-like domain-containing protein [Candidatus Methylobacter oryzae]TRX03878.1 cupin-like domain-containing protein [Candidatus Methylobacter oryzae]